MMDKARLDHLAFELREAWDGEGRRVNGKRMSFRAWVEDEADSPRGIFNTVAQEYLALRAARPGHTLLFRSLRDLQAVCSCGHWSLTRPTFDHDRDEDIRWCATAEHIRHCRRTNHEDSSCH